jgi:hypothetical protein
MTAPKATGDILRRATGILVTAGGPIETAPNFLCSAEDATDENAYIGASAI